MGSTVAVALQNEARPESPSTPAGSDTKRQRFSLAPGATPEPYLPRRRNGDARAWEHFVRVQQRNGDDMAEAQAGKAGRHAMPKSCIRPPTAFLGPASVRVREARGFNGEGEKKKKTQKKRARWNIIRRVGGVGH